MINPITGDIVATADRIMAETDDPEIRLAALKWKATTAPLYREALFAPQPLIAVLDALGFSYQLMDYFKTGEGAEEFGPYAPQAYQCVDRIRLQLSDYMDDVSDHETMHDGLNAAETREVIREWATDHPIGAGIESRESLYGEASEISLELGMELGQAVDAMVTTMDDLNYKIDVLSAQAPDQARWETEIAAYQAMKNLNVREAIEDVGPVLGNTRAALAQATESLDTLPELVAEERAAVLADLERQLNIALASLTKEREAFMSEVTREREAVMAEVAENRIAIMNDVATQIDEIEQLVARERKLFVSDVEVMRRSLVAEFFRNVYIVLALIGAFLVFLTAAVLWVLDRRVWRHRALANPDRP